jgi:polyphosphate glucokinase
MGPLTGGTLTIDISGGALKMRVLGSKGDPLNDRVKSDLPDPPKTRAVVELAIELAMKQPPFERVSVGIPGVVMDGVVISSPGLDREWANFALANRLQEELRRPVRVANNTDLEGFGAIERHGVEMVLTLGLGLGSALFVDGALVPNLELGRHPFRSDKTYEEYVGKRALEKLGRKKWSRRVLDVLEQIQPVWNCRTIHLGGGNAKKLDIELPSNVRPIASEAGMLGGIYLWRD